MLLPLLLASSWSVAKPDRLLAANPLVALPDRSMVKPIVDPRDWRAMHLIAPKIVQQVSIPEYQFNHNGVVPALRLDGDSFNFALPPALWVKLEFPGQAFLYMDTDAGLFVKPLDEATPGFVSRCALGRHGYANADGEAVKLDTAALKINALWIVQDAQAEGGHTPGWISLAPPNNEPTYVANF